MKALTIRQPWASLITDGVKSIETRSWNTSYRGPLAIHAGAAKPPNWFSQWGDEYKARGGAPWHDVLERYCYGDELDDGWWCQSWSRPLGSIVARARLAGCVPIIDAMNPPEEFQGNPPCRQYVSRSVIDDRVILVLSTPAVDNGRCYGSTVTDLTGQDPFGDFTPGRFAWFLEDIEKLDDPIPAKGRQGLWESEWAR